jgi:hypothetical protein
MATGVSLTKTDDIATIIGDNIMVVVTLMTVFLFFVFFCGTTTCSMFLDTYFPTMGNLSGR